MRIVFIGSGNLATRLSLRMKQCGFEILQIYSHTLSNAKILASKIECDYTDSIENINDRADLYIFSIKDSILEDVISKVKSNKGIWVHTAGSLSIDVFSKYKKECGVFYPLQTFSKEKECDFSQIPIFVEGSTKDVESKLTKAASRISDKIYNATSEQRKYLHLSAVFACNFTNHMYAIAERLLKENNLPFEAIMPLIDETALKIKTLSAIKAQTGPAVRKDVNVMGKQIELLKDEKFKNIYKILSDNIIDFSE
ncbi:MAG: DUF2520 domain-containing protein [Bacteroidales bacterium]|nr:DUF2520 domain-containing protein [Bacteroidales bacterium]